MQIQIDTEHMQKRLREQQKVLEGQVELEKNKTLPGETTGQNQADLASDYAYRVHHLSVLERLEDQLDKVNKALQRIEDGIYGVCTNCGEVIMPERLEALPYAEFCIPCQARKE